jgi:hypothetical protein
VIGHKREVLQLSQQLLLDDIVPRIFVVTAKTVGYYCENRYFYAATDKIASMSRMGPGHDGSYSRGWMKVVCIFLANVTGTSRKTPMRYRIITASFARHAVFGCSMESGRLAVHFHDGPLYKSESY